MIIKKKLRNISLEELKMWKEKHCSAHCLNCVFSNVYCSESSSDCWINNKDIYSDKFLNQEIEIEIKDVLDEIEKKYLESIIRPFKDRVEYIKKQKGVNRNSINPCYHVVIMLKNAVNNYATETIVLPYFKSESKMYEGMNLNKEYTLKELGLL